MGIAVQLRSDYTADDLRASARDSDDSVQTRRLLSLAEIYDGGARGRAGRVGGVGLQTIRDWVWRFNAGGPDGLVDKKPPNSSHAHCARSLKRHRTTPSTAGSGPRSTAAASA